MSSTKIVIIVLILVAVIFVIFVTRGALRNEPEKDPDQEAAEFTEKPPGWTKAIKGFIGSRQPKIDLERSIYTANTVEKIKADSENPIRTAKFRVRPGSSASILYEDDTEDAGDLKRQPCDLPNSKNKQDKNACSIVALKKGGKLTINCPATGGCRVEVEK